MTTETPADPLDQALEQMAQFDRQECALAPGPEPWWAADGVELTADQACELGEGGLSDDEQERLAVLLTPLDDETSQSILDSIAAQSSSEAPSRSSAPGRPGWMYSTIALATLSIAAALLLWLSRDPGAESAGLVPPHRVELGGTAHMLGATADGPRAYRRGDNFVLRATAPAGQGAAAEAELYAIPEGGGRRQQLALPFVRIGEDTLEYRASIADHLPAGRWILRLELGTSAACARGSDGCFETEVSIEILDR